MSDNNDAGGNTGGGQNNDGGAQSQGGDGKTTTGGSGSQASSGQQQSQGGQGTSSSGTGDKTFTQADVDRIVADRLARSKQQHDADLVKARDNATKTLQQQLDDITKQLSDRQAADVERNGKLALATVYSHLAEAGVPKADVKDVLDTFDPTRLLKDGEPDDAVIEKFAKSLAKVAGRVTPDPDQGQNGNGSSPQTMGDFMRQMKRNAR